VDGYVGEAPLTFNLPPGEHRIFFEKEGFQPQVEKISIAEGEKASLKVSLFAMPFSLFVESSPNGAEIFIDGASRGVTPQTLDVPTGKHELTLSLEGYEPTKENMEGALGQKLSISKTLLAKPSTIQFEILPARAEIHIEGREEVFAANASTELPPGDYTVVIKALGYEEKKIPVSVQKGKAESITSTLQPTQGLLLVKASSDVSVTIAEQLKSKNELQALPPRSSIDSHRGARKSAVSG